MNSYLVKVKRCTANGWENTIHLFAVSHLEAERQAKKIFAKQYGIGTSDVDARSIREDAPDWAGRMGK